jgi:hypothetical protein
MTILDGLNGKDAFVQINNLSALLINVLNAGLQQGLLRHLELPRLSDLLDFLRLFELLDLQVMMHITYLMYYINI